MSVSWKQSTARRGKFWQITRWIILALVAAFIIRIALKAILSPLMVDDFPEALAIKAMLLPHLFPLHMITGGLALFLVPIALLLRHRPRWHRWAGRIAALDVAFAGITAFPVALIAPVTRISAWGFAAQGSTWLLLLALGIWNIRRKQRAAHRAAMLLMTATTSGAIFFRIYLALWAIWGDFRYYETFYAFNAWFAWTLPLAAMAFFLKRTGLLRLDHQ